MPIAAVGESASAQSVDNSRSYSIDASGAQHGVAEQITAALHQYDGHLNRTLNGRMRNSRQRYQ